MRVTVDGTTGYAEVAEAARAGTIAATALDRRICSWRPRTDSGERKPKPSIPSPGTPWSDGRSWVRFRHEPSLRPRAERRVGDPPQRQPELAPAPGYRTGAVKGHRAGTGLPDTLRRDGFVFAGAGDGRLPVRSRRSGRQAIRAATRGRRGRYRRLQAELDKEVHRRVEVIDDDAHVVHPFDGHGSSLRLGSFGATRAGAARAHGRGGHLAAPRAEPRRRMMRIPPRSWSFPGHEPDRVATIDRAR